MESATLKDGKYRCLMMMSEVGKHYRRGLHQEQGNGAISDSLSPLARGLSTATSKKSFAFLRNNK